MNFLIKPVFQTKEPDLDDLADDEKAFYSDIAFDFEVDTSFGWLELVACNYRSDYDLLSHSTISKTNLYVMDDETKVLPHVFELSLGIDRCIYSIFRTFIFY